MARFHFTPENKLIVGNNCPHRAEPFYVDENDGYLIVNALAENDAFGAYEPLYGVISIKDTVSVYGKLILTDWGNGHYDVDCPLTRVQYFAPPTAVSQNSAIYRGTEFTATVYRDNATRLLLECGGDTANFTLPDVASPEILLRPSNRGMLAVVNCKSDAEYLLIILYNGKYVKLYETSAEKITFTERAFTVTENLKDMLGRRRITDYAFSGVTLEKTAQKFSYREERQYPDELTPYLMLEALQAGDRIKMKSYLSDDLQADADALIPFFGSFGKIQCPKYRGYTKKSDLSTVALIKYGGNIIRPKFFTFSVENGKIVNVSD